MATLPVGIIPPPPDVATFRQVAPAFADKGLFPDDSVTFWLAAAAILLNQSLFGVAYGLATILFIEHNLALEALASEQGAMGGIPGLSRGVISGESAKSVSASYDSGLAAEKDAGHWNLTVYGTRLIRMIMLFGAGPIQVNTGPACYGGAFAGYTQYSGPPFGPGWWG